MLLAPSWSVADSEGVIISDPSDEVTDFPGVTKPSRGADGGSKVLADTTWIADYTFDTPPPPPGVCNSSGWTHYDHRILYDGTNFWTVDNRFDLIGAFTGKAAVLSKHDLCWSRDGYGNEWDYSIVVKYQDGASLDFDFITTTETWSIDYFKVEADSLGLSEARNNSSTDPSKTPEDFRDVVFPFAFPTPFPGSQHFGPQPLPTYGPGTHEVYLRFLSSERNSDADGGNSSGPLHAGVAIDNISVSGPLAYTESFDGVLNSNVQLLNTAPAKPIGDWARLFSHITDNDRDTENTTCAWTFTNPLRPAFIADMAFGPSATVVQNWLDNVLESPWISLASTPSSRGTVLSFRTFPGQRFSESKIIQGWKVRAKRRVDNTDTPAPGDLIDCLTPWKLVGGTYYALDSWNWQTQVLGMSALIPTDAIEIQVQARVTDAQYIAGEPAPSRLNPGPGPFLDRIRIGRGIGIGKASGASIGPVLVAWTGARSQAQDAFPLSLIHI